jgi:predicted GH43/DUF377 family glycosyl hydrolase
MNKILIIPAMILLFNGCGIGSKKSVSLPEIVPQERMEEIYKEIKTPYKYGLVLIPPNPSKKVDCPSVFRIKDQWYMTYLVFDGRGYETWLAESDDLLHWEHLGKIMSFSDSSQWDDDQKAGYIALQDYHWGGSYELQQYDHKYWMSYIGGSQRGYEAGILSIGMAYTEQDPSTVHEWNRLDQPILMPTDEDARWWENSTMYKSTVIWDKEERIGFPFIMYFNARGDSLRPHRGAERIGMAVSEDMVKWHRYMEDPVLDHHRGITGDPYIQLIDDTWVMFYFGAFWENRPAAFNRFACSYDLIHWTDWTGEDLIAPSEPYDNRFAHKSFVVKNEDVVFHFYCAVNKNDDRGIALATSREMGNSELNFNNQIIPEQP